MLINFWNKQCPGLDSSPCSAVNFVWHVDQEGLPLLVSFIICEVKF